MKFSTTNFPKIFRGIIPEKYRYFFRRKFPEISEFTTLHVTHSDTCILFLVTTARTYFHNNLETWHFEVGAGQLLTFSQVKSGSLKFNFSLIVKTIFLGRMPI